MKVRINAGIHGVFTAMAIASLLCLVCFELGCRMSESSRMQYTAVETIAGTGGEFGEPFGIAVRDGDVFVSDGESGKIWRIVGDGKAVAYTTGLETPSAIAFDSAGDLIVADSGSNTINKIDRTGKVTLVAGTAGKSGFADGDAGSSLFNGPIGIAVGEDGKLFVADTYNDRIRVIENGKVSTLAGGNWGFADGVGLDAKFFTPCSIAIWQDRLLVTDTGNRRIRVVEPDGRVWTLAGSGDGDLKDGLLSSASFVAPTALAVDKYGSIFLTDGNAIRQIGGRTMPFVSTISDVERGLRDGKVGRARFNRPSGLAFDDSGRVLVADSDNRVIRRLSTVNSGQEITPEQIEALRDMPEEFRNRKSPRWPFNPPDVKRDIAGTLGEIRGEMKDDSDQVWFHNGLDIAGAYGETVRFIRDEAVLQPMAAANFGSLRELLRMPTIGYIHLRLGRDSSNRSFGDPRFQFLKNVAGTIVSTRIPRGTKFNAGEPIGTLNAMNHVHLITGRSGSEMNALDALIFLNLTDSRPPTIENISLFDENWREIETASPNSRIKLTGKTRIIMRAYDQVDGNADRRRLGLYQAGYRILHGDGSPLSDTQWTIKFDRLPVAAAVAFVYADGSKSGATGETIFDYIVTNRVECDDYRQDFLDTAGLDNGGYILRVFAADYFGNTSFKDVSFEVTK